MGYIDKNGNYYEGDRQEQDQEVPQRPGSEYVWQNGAWVVDTIKQKEAANIPILSRITSLEQKQLRPLREYALGDITALPRIQAIDSEISALRAQLK